MTACRAAVLACCSVAALGGTAAARPLRELSLEELLELEVVTPTAKAQKAAEAPATVFVFPADVIRQRGYRYLGELLEDVPEIQVDRGSDVEVGDVFSTRGMLGNRNLVVLRDGVRITSATGNSHALREGYSLENIERVEVVLGPASALYGADAFAGVVHLISRGGAALRGGSVTGALGRFGTREASFAVGDRVDGVAFAVSGSLYHSDGPTLPDFYRRDYAWYHERYRPAGEVRVSPFAAPDQVVVVRNEPYAAPRDGSSINARLDVGDFVVSYGRLAEGLSSSTGARPEFSLAIPDARWSYRIEQVAGQHRYASADERVQLGSTLSFQRYEVRPDSAYINSFGEYVASYKHASDLVARLEERISFQPSSRWTFSAGGSFDDARVLPKTADLGFPLDPDVAPTAQGEVYPGSDLVEASGRRLGVPIDFNAYRYRSLGAFAEVVAQPIDALGITAGVRFDHDSRYGHTINPRAGVVGRPFDQTRVKLLYGEAYLAPSPLEAYAHYGAFAPATDGEGNVVGLRSDFFFLPNPALEPQKLRMVEASIAQQVGDLRACADAYYARERGVILPAYSSDEVFKGWPVATVGRNVNRGHAEIMGGSIVLSYRWHPRAVTILPSLAYTYVDGDIDGGRLDRLVRHTANGLVDVSWWRLSASARVRLRGRGVHRVQTDASGEGLRAPRSGVVDLAARWSDLDLGVARGSAFLTIENLLDARYYHLSGGVETFAAVPQDPFRVLVGFTAER